MRVLKIPRGDKELIVMVGRKRKQNYGTTTSEANRASLQYAGTAQGEGD